MMMNKKREYNLILVLWIETLIFLSCVYLSTWAGNFSSSQDLEGASDSSLAWGDYDNDGDLDLALCGDQNYGRITFTKIYRNEGGTLTEDETQSIDGVLSGSLAWGDYDNDGDLDLAIWGFKDSTKIYRNDGGTLNEDETQNLPGRGTVRGGGLAWVDYDNDGDLDLSLCRFTKIYRNESGNLIEDTDQELPGASNSFLAWGDYDNDGDSDLAWCGDFQKSGVYNNHEARLTKAQVLEGIDTLGNENIAWGDYDNDGDLDLAWSGWTGSGGCCKIYRNDSGVLTEVQDIIEIYGSSLAWGDYDNDGDLDLFLSGYSPEPELKKPVSKVYRNNSGTFIEDDSQNIVGVWDASLALADYDNDGDLDLALSGASVCRIYVNDEAVVNPNSIPSPPTNFSSNYVGGVLTLTWNDGSDVETQAKGLYYNIRVSTVSGSNNVVSGIYGSPLLGNYLRPKISSTTLGINLRYLPEGCTYYWNVQTIDTGLKASNWSAEQSYYIPFSGVPFNSPTITSITPNIGVNTGFAEITNLWGTNFYSGAKVELIKAGEPIIVAGDVVVESDIKITCKLDITDVRLGTWDVVVTNVNGKSGGLSKAFTIIGAKPNITGIIPDQGENTRWIEINNLSGENFYADAVVKLTKQGQPDIEGVDIRIVNRSKITCLFNLTWVAPGDWNVVIVNTDSQSAVLDTGFKVTMLKPLVISIVPNSGLNRGIIEITNLTGKYFYPGATVKLIRSGEDAIVGTNVSVVNPSKIFCVFDLTDEVPGKWDIVVTNIDEQNGVLEKGFTIGAESRADEEELLVYPNPYRADRGGAEQIIFSNLVPESTIRIYTISGDLVETIMVDNNVEDWPVKEIGSGVYIYHISSPSGEKSGKLSIIK